MKKIYSILILVIFIFNLLYICSCKDVKLCVDPKCAEPVSKAVSNVRYEAPQPFLLSFKSNQEMEIFSKLEGSKHEYWGAEINGKRGYVPKRLVREVKMFKNPTVEVAYHFPELNEIFTNAIKTDIPKGVSGETSSPAKVLPLHEVVDGTTFYQDSEDILMKPTESIIDSTTIKEELQNEDSRKTSNFESEYDDEDEWDLDYNNVKTESTLSSKELLNQPVNNKNSDFKLKIVEPIVNELKKESEEFKIEKNSIRVDNKVSVNKNNEIDSSQETILSVDNKLPPDIQSNTLEKGYDEFNKKISESEENEISIDSLSENNSSILDTQNSKYQDKLVNENKNLNTSGTSVMPDHKDLNLSDNSDTLSDGNTLNKLESGVKLSQQAIAESAEFSTPMKVNEQIGNRNEVTDNTKKMFENDIELETTVIQNKEYLDSNQETISTVDKLQMGIETNTPKTSNKEFNKENNESQLEGKSEADIINEGNLILKENKTEVQTDSSLQSNSSILDTQNSKYQDKSVNGNKNLNSFNASVNSTDPNVPNLTDNPEVKSDQSNGIFGASISDSNSINKLESDINLSEPAVVESVEFSTSMEANSQIDKIGNEGEVQHSVEPAAIEITTDNTTMDYYRVENISENKIEYISHETVISSPENVDVSITLNEIDSQIDKNVDTNTLDESTSQRSIHDVESNMDLNSGTLNENSLENKPNVDAYSFFDTKERNQKSSLIREDSIPNNDLNVETPNINVMETVINNDEISNPVNNIYDTETGEKSFTESLIDEIQASTEENVLVDSSNDVIQEQADFWISVFEFFGIFQIKKPIIDTTHSDLHSSDSQSVIGNEEISHTNREQLHCKNPNIGNIYSLQQFEIPESTYGMIIYLTITAVTVLLFTLGYYYIEKLRQDGTLIKRINELEKALLNSNKEKNILRNELEVSQGAEAPISLLEKLRDELEESNRLRIELEEQNVNLERELETATEAGLELNKMLGEYLSSQQSGDLVEKSLEYLQKQLNDQQMTIAEMTVSANEKAKEFDSNVIELKASHEKINELKSEMNSLVVNLTTLQEDSYSRETQLNEQIHILKSQLEKEISEKNFEIQEKNNELNKIKDLLKQLQHNVNVKENELELLKKNLQSGKEVGDIKNLIDNTEIRAELKEVLAEKDLLIKQLETENELQKSLENQLKQTINEKENLHIQLQNVEKEKIESQTRLEVLSAYFKEKETQLQKELAKHEELWLQNQGQANSTVERIKLLQEEIQNYKSQNETLKNEIVDQEVSLKSQISVLEKKHNENWLLLRQTERRLEESKHECSQLRNRLTIVEKNLNSEDKSQFRVLSPPLNGDINTSPIHIADPPVSSPLLFPHRDNMPTSPPISYMGLPPPPPPPGAMPFMPPPPPGVPFMPPPPTLFPGDRRPPPLGRMSSPPPPPPNTFSPTRIFSPYDQDRESPPSRDRIYNLYDDNNYRHRSPPPYTHLPPPPTDQVKEWESRQSFRPIDQQRTTNRSKTNLNSNEFV